MRFVPAPWLSWPRPPSYRVVRDCHRLSWESQVSVCTLYTVPYPHPNPFLLSYSSPRDSQWQSWTVESTSGTNHPVNHNIIVLQHYDGKGISTITEYYLSIIGLTRSQVDGIKISKILRRWTCIIIIITIDLPLCKHAIGSIHRSNIVNNWNQTADCHKAVYNVKEPSQVWPSM